METWITGFKLLLWLGLILVAIGTVGKEYWESKKNRLEEAERGAANKNLTQQLTQTKEANQRTLDELKENRKLLEPFIDLAQRQFPGKGEQEALASLSQRIDTLDNAVKAGKTESASLTAALNKEKNTIKSLEMKVSIVFSGNWNQPPFPVWYDSPGGFTGMKWIGPNGLEMSFVRNKISYVSIDSRTAKYENIFEILPGMVPLGEQLNRLNDFTHSTVFMLFTQAQNLIDGDVTFASIQLECYLNGTKRGEYAIFPNQVGHYNVTEEDIKEGRTNLTIPLEFTIPPVKLLNIDISE